MRPLAAALALAWATASAAPATAATQAEARRAMADNLRAIVCSVVEVHGVVQTAVVVLCLLALVALSITMMMGQGSERRVAPMLAMLALATMSVEIAAWLLTAGGDPVCGRGAAP